MNLWLVAGGSVTAIAAGLVLAGALDHLLWKLEQQARERHAGRRRGTLDLRQPA